jgi:ribosomal protein L7/L12
MHIEVISAGFTVSFTPATFAEFHTEVAEGQKITAIKRVRGLKPEYGLKEAKDFVEGCFFAGSVPTKLLTYDQQQKVRAIKSQIKSIILADNLYDAKESAFAAYEEAVQILA